MFITQTASLIRLNDLHLVAGLFTRSLWTRKRLSNEELLIRLKRKIYFDKRRKNGRDRLFGHLCPKTVDENSRTMTCPVIRSLKELTQRTKFGLEELAAGQHKKKSAFYETRKSGVMFTTDGPLNPTLKMLNPATLSHRIR
jgi:hypothetical protein